MTGRMPISRLVVWIAAVVVVAAGLSAALFLAGGPVTDDSRSTLTVALPAFGAEVMDPSADGQNGQRYYGHMYDRLLGTGPGGKPDTGTGALAGWTSSADAKSFTLRLREGMRWHDGVEVTSDDLKFSLEHYARQAAACSACGSILWLAQKIKTIDRYRVEATLKEPDAGFAARLGPQWEDVPLLPAQYLERVGQEGFAEQPIGSGPWKFVSRVPGESIEFEANLDYWDPARVPGFDRLRLELVAGRRDRLDMLREGTIDMALVAPEDIESLKSDGFTIDGPKFVVETAIRFFMSYDPGILTSNKVFRKALILGMDLGAIMDNIYPPEAAALVGGSPMFGPLTEGYDPELSPYPHDQQQAIELLRESGYSGETVHLLSIPTYDLTEMPLVNEMIADDWRRIGLEVETVSFSNYGPVKILYLERPQRFADYLPAPVFSGGHVGRPGGIVNSIDRYLTSSNLELLSYHDLEGGDRVYARILALTEREEREGLLKELNRRLYEEYWAAPIVWRHDVWALRPGLAGWEPTDGTSSDLHLETIRPTGKVPG